MTSSRSSVQARRFTSAHAIALLALFIALSGTVYAATRINGRSIRKGSIPANRVKRNSLAGAQIREESLGTVPSAVKAATATSATNAASATNATNAATAGNAKTLNGIPSAGYQQACKSGAIKASLVVDTTGLGPTDTTVPGFNCAGGSIQIQRTATGTYAIHFAGTTSGTAVAGSTTEGLGVSVKVVPDQTRGGEPAFLVEVFKASTQTFQDGAKIVVLVF